MVVFRIDLILQLKHCFENQGQPQIIESSLRFSGIQVLESQKT